MNKHMPTTYRRPSHTRREPRGCVSRCPAVVFPLLIALVASFTARPAQGRDRFPAVRLDSGLVVVPFAVPVATPVAVVGPGQVSYAYAPSLPASSSTAAEAIDPQLRAEFEAFRRWRESQRAVAADSAARSVIEVPGTDGVDQNVVASPLLAANCLRCHAGAQAKGNVRLDGRLTDAQRLTAIRAALSGEMPKGRPLAADALGRLLYELSQRSDPLPPVTSSTDP